VARHCWRGLRHVRYGSKGDGLLGPPLFFSGVAVAYRALLSSTLLLVLGASALRANEAKPEKGVAAPPPAETIDGAGTLDEPRKVAEAYLKALAGKGDDHARNYLLGGVTLTANEFSIPNWRIKKRDAARVEEGDTDGAIRMLRDLERRGAELLNAVVVAGDENSLVLSQAQAEKLMEPTRNQAQLFIEKYPVFSYIARVGRSVFWHPENPFLKEIRKLPKGGRYRLDVHRFHIEEIEHGQSARIWPLRVLRMTANDYDSGWKILPASDWDPSY
jgi:hypothetical protein